MAQITNEEKDLNEVQIPVGRFKQYLQHMVTAIHKVLSNPKNYQYTLELAFITFMPQDVLNNALNSNDTTIVHNNILQALQDQNLNAHTMTWFKKQSFQNLCYVAAQTILYLGFGYDMLHQILELPEDLCGEISVWVNKAPFLHDVKMNNIVTNLILQGCEIWKTQKGYVVNGDILDTYWCVSVFHSNAHTRNKNLMKQRWTEQKPQPLTLHSPYNTTDLGLPTAFLMHMQHT